MKRVIVALLLALALLPTTVLAYNYPAGFWDINTKYIEASSAKDYYNIIKYGEQTVSIVKNTPDAPEKRDIIITRLNEIGAAYAELGEYEKAAAAYMDLCNYADINDTTYGEYVRGAEARVLQYETSAIMYADGGSAANYGARNEPQNGVLFGVSSDGETRKLMPNETAVLTYQELGQTLLPYNRNIISKANEDKNAVVFALNCPNEGDDIRNIHALMGSLEEISALLNEYPDVTVYLRFGAEFDVWTVRATPQEYVNAFRMVADHFHRTNKNVAMVWSPNHISAWDVDRDEFYPGDSYVDWVGVSLYSGKYFLGDKSQSEFNNIYFRCGDGADPVLAMRDIIRTYGDRKPIMISEYGAGHKTISTGEDTTEFARQRLSEVYGYLPIVYPQLKLIAYFDAYINNGLEKYDYRLSTNNVLQGEYLRFTRGERYIQDSIENNVSKSYREVTDGAWLGSVFEAAVYGHRYKTAVSKVTYAIDDKYAGMAQEVPFKTHIDATDYTGVHTLSSIVEFADGTTRRIDKAVTFSPARDITVTINGSKIYFEQEPVIYNERTMVPMRKIFEVLGATVSWDGATKTVTARRDSTTIKVTIGESKLYVNGEAYMLDTAPIILNGSTLVPVRAISEALRCGVDWDGNTYTVIITD